MSSTHLNKATTPLQLLMASMPKKGAGGESDDARGAEFADLLTPLKPDDNPLAEGQAGKHPGLTTDSPTRRAALLDPSMSVPAALPESKLAAQTGEKASVVTGQHPGTGLQQDGKKPITQPGTSSTAGVTETITQSGTLVGRSVNTVRHNRSDEPGSLRPATVSATLQTTDAAVTTGEKSPGIDTKYGSKSATRAVTAGTGPVSTAPLTATSSQISAHSVQTLDKVTGNVSNASQTTNGQPVATTPFLDNRGAAQNMETSGTSASSTRGVLSGAPQLLRGKSIPTTHTGNGVAGRPGNGASGRIPVGRHSVSPAQGTTVPAASGTPATTNTQMMQSAGMAEATAESPRSKAVTSRLNKVATRVATTENVALPRHAETDTMAVPVRASDTTSNSASTAGSVGTGTTTGSVTAAATSPLGLQSASPVSIDPINLEPIDAALGEPAFSEQLFDRLSVMLRGPLGQASIRLHPEELGPIRVELNVDGQQANLRISAAHADTRAALDASLNDLREQFSQEGLELQDAQIDDDQPSHEDPAQPQEQQRPGHRAGTPVQDEKGLSDNGIGEVSTQSEDRATVRPPTDGRIDLIA